MGRHLSVRRAICKVGCSPAAPTARAEQALKEYLYLWYSQCADYAWYNTVNNTNDAYYGYWCFEAAALVRILGLNEDALASREYYPKL